MAGPFESFAVGNQNANAISGVGHAIAEQIQQAHARDLGSELAARDALAKQFEAIEQDPTYDQKARLAARDHAFALKFLKPTDKRPKQYQLDKDGRIPALVDVTYRKVLKHGPDEPPAPAEPIEPSGPEGGAGLAPPPNVSAGLGPTPGGVQPMPGKVSPAPAVGLPPMPTELGASPLTGGAGPQSAAGVITGLQPPPSMGPTASDGITPPPADGDSPDGASTRMDPEQMALNSARIKSHVDEFQRSAMAASLRKLGVPDALIQKALVDSIPGVNLQTGQRQPQSLVIKDAAGNMRAVRALWDGSNYNDAMTGQPLHGEVVNGVQWVDAGDRKILTDSLGKPLGPQIDKSQKQVEYHIDPITGNIISMPVVRSKGGISGGSGSNGGSGDGGIAPPPIKPDLSSRAPTTKPATATAAAATSAPSPVASANARTVDELIPGDDPVATNARAIVNGNMKLADMQGNALRNRVQSTLDRAGVVLLNDKDKGALEDAVRVRQLTNDLRGYVLKLQADPLSPSTINLLNSTIESIRGIYAKGTFRETGVLTDRDIERSGAMLPGGKMTALQSATGIMDQQPLKKLDQLDTILRRGLTLHFRGRRGQWLQGFGRRDEVLPTATDDVIHQYADRLGNDRQKVRAALVEDGWEIPPAKKPKGK